MSVCVEQTTEGFFIASNVDDCSFYILEQSEVEQLYAVVDLGLIDVMTYFGTPFALVLASYFLSYPISIALSVIRKL